MLNLLGWFIWELLEMLWNDLMGHCAIEGGKTYCPQRKFTRKKEKKRKKQVRSQPLLYYTLLMMNKLGFSTRANFVRKFQPQQCCPVVLKTLVRQWCPVVVVLNTLVLGDADTPKKWVSVHKARCMLKIPRQDLACLSQLVLVANCQRCVLGNWPFLRPKLHVQITCSPMYQAFANLTGIKTIYQAHPYTFVH